MPEIATITLSTDKVDKLFDILCTAHMHAYEMHKNATTYKEKNATRRQMTSIDEIIPCIISGTEREYVPHTRM